MIFFTIRKLTGLQNMNKWKRLTGQLLVVSGGFLILAVVPLFFPIDLMKVIHQWLGLGEMPDSPIAVYLARSTSMLYAVHGFVTVYTGLKIERLWPMAALLGFLHVGIGLTMIGVDLNAGMPAYWVAGEGGPIAGLGALILYLWNRGNQTDDADNRAEQVGLKDN